MLEIGAGDGILCTSLAEVIPEASILGIDISADPGRMVPEGDQRVTFRQVSTSALLEEGVEQFDLVVVADVLHHVPVDEREQLLADAASLLTPAGLLVIKEWERTRSASHLAADFADRYISGDRQVSFMTRGELRDLMLQTAPSLHLAAEASVYLPTQHLLMAFRAFAS